MPPSFTPSLGTQSNVGHESRLKSSTASRCSETQCGPHTASWVRVAKGDSLPPTAVGEWQTYPRALSYALLCVLSFAPSLGLGMAWTGVCYGLPLFLESCAARTLLLLPVIRVMSVSIGFSDFGSSPAAWRLFHLQCTVGAWLVISFGELCQFGFPCSCT